MSEATCISCDYYLYERATGNGTLIQCGAVQRMVKLVPKAHCALAKDRRPGSDRREDWDDDLPDGEGLI